MSERLRKGIVYGALLLAIVWGVYNFLPKSEPIPAAQVSAPETAVLPVPAELPFVEKSINVAEMIDKGWGEDPFRALDKGTNNQADNDEPHWKLSGIVYSSARPLAIINGKSVTVGARLGKAIVKEIGRKTVTLDQAGKKVILRVFKGE